MTRVAPCKPASVGWLCCGLLVCVSACHKADDSKPARPKPSASAPKPRPLAPACKALRAGASFTLGDTAFDNKTLADAGGEDVELPFAVELGSAVSYADGYAVAALANDSEGSKASVAVVSRDARQGRVLDLGRVHGDVVPPGLAAHQSQLIAAVVDNDAGSQTLRLLALQPSAPQPLVSRGPSFSQGRDDSSAFDLAFSGNQGLLVWDRYDKPSGHSVVEASSFTAAAIADAAPPRVISHEGDDAEMPRIVPRVGGFWLAYVAHGAPLPEAPAAAPDAALDNVVDTTPRRLTIVPLDANGTPSGQPRRITKERSYVLAYDLAGDPAGALLAWRDDPTTLGVEAPVVYFARVKADGSFQVERIEDDEFGAGAPALLVEAPGGKQHPWVGVMGTDYVLRLSLVGDGPKVESTVPLSPNFRLAEPLVRSGADLLLARPRGRVVDLSVVRCEER